MSSTRVNNKIDIKAFLIKHREECRVYLRKHSHHEKDVKQEAITIFVTSVATLAGTLIAPGIGTALGSALGALVGYYIAKILQERVEDINKQIDEATFITTLKEEELDALANKLEELLRNNYAEEDIVNLIYHEIEQIQTGKVNPLSILAGTPPTTTPKPTLALPNQAPEAKYTNTTNNEANPAWRSKPSHDKINHSFGLWETSDSLHAQAECKHSEHNADEIDNKLENRKGLVTVNSV